jgi:hypothetical protein
VVVAQPAALVVAEEPEDDIGPTRAPRSEKSEGRAGLGPELGRRERQHGREGQKHRAARVVVPVGVHLLLGELDAPARLDLVALEALANTGQSLIELRAVASEEGDGQKQSGSELLRIRRPADRFELRDLHNHRFDRLASRLPAQMPVDRGLKFGSVRCIRHLTEVVSEDES